MVNIIFENVTLTRTIDFSKASLTKTIATVGGRLSKSKKNITTVTALSNVSFSLSKGDLLGITGHNGAGKTTLLRTIAGIYTPSSGKVFCEGKVSTMIELGSGLDSELTGYENIIRFGLLQNMNIKEIKDSIPSIEEFTELGEFLNAPVHTYSSGMLTRLMFAISTANKPEILLVDEVFSTGDAKFQQKAIARMQNIISTAEIFVFASHSSELINKLCNKVLELENGEIKTYKRIKV
jgi:ABC-2 type transport system ATP-binding protein